MDKVPRETGNTFVTGQEAGKKPHMAFDLLLLVSAAVVIGALAVGMYIMVSS